MPTGGKLIAAITFAALAYFISDLIKPLLENTEGARVGMLSPVNAFIGWLMGWTIMGKGAGRTYYQSAGYAFTTVAATAFWCLLFWSGQKMLGASMNLRYDGPSEALQQMGVMFFEYLAIASERSILITAAAGTLFAAWLTEFFARRWG